MVLSDGGRTSGLDGSLGGMATTSAFRVDAPLRSGGAAPMATQDTVFINGVPVSGPTEELAESPGRMWNGAKEARLRAL